MCNISHHEAQEPLVYEILDGIINNEGSKFQEDENSNFKRSVKMIEDYKLQIMI